MAPSTPKSSQQQSEQETPPEERRLISRFMAGLSAQLAVVEQNVSKNIGHKIESRVDSLEAKINDQVSGLGDNFSKLEDKFTQLNSTVQYNNQLANDNAASLAKLRDEQLVQKQEFQKQNTLNAATVRSINVHMNEIDTKVEQYMKVTDKTLSDKVKEMDKLLEQFKGANFSSGNQPTPREIFLMKKAYNMSNNAIGFYPVTDDDLDMIAQQTPGIGTKDKYRVAVADYLTLEMSFSEEWVKQLENHYTTFIYDGVNTLYLCVSDLTDSGAKQIWQESPVLREEGQRQTRELRRLEVPQFRARLKAM